MRALGALVRGCLAGWIDNQSGFWNMGQKRNDVLGALRTPPKLIDADTTTATITKLLMPLAGTNTATDLMVSPEPTTLSP